MVGVAVIGCAAAGRRHLETYAELARAGRGLRIVAVADVVELRARETAERFGVEHWFTDPLQTLSTRGVDAVDICVPPTRHAELVVAVATAGKPALVESPIATSLADCDRMIESCRRAGTKLHVLQPARSGAAGRQLGAAVSAGAIGRPVFIRLSEYAASKITDAQALSEELLVSVVDDVDLACWLASSTPQSARVRSATHGSKDGAAWVHAWVGMATGASALIAHYRGPMSTSLRWTHVLGDAGECQHETRSPTADREPTSLAETWDEATVGGLEVWIDGLEVGDPSLASAREAQATLALALETLGRATGAPR